MGEKRKHRRYLKRLKVRFGEKTLNQAGFTGDVSAAGMFIIASPLPVLGTRLHLELALDAERALYFEGVTQRHVQVEPALRQVVKGGFGVRLLTPGELLGEVIPHAAVQQPAFRITYATQAALANAFQGELQKGGVLVRCATPPALNSVVSVELELAFQQQRVQLQARVVHVGPDGTGGFNAALVFVDPGSVLPGLAAAIK